MVFEFLIFIGIEFHSFAPDTETAFTQFPSRLLSFIFIFVSVASRADGDDDSTVAPQIVIDTKDGEQEYSMDFWGLSIVYFL